MPLDGTKLSIPAILLFNPIPLFGVLFSAPNKGVRNEKGQEEIFSPTLLPTLFINCQEIKRHHLLKYGKKMVLGTLKKLSQPLPF